MKKKIISCLVVVLLILLFDQWLKFWVKTTFIYGHSRPVLGDWFELHFIENNGFAFGKELGGRIGKLILSLFRLVAVSVLGWYIFSLIKDKAANFRFGYILMVSLIFAGALGNIIDSVFYGVLFSESNYHVSELATFLPVGGGYEAVFYGRVVDMLHFPVVDTMLPDWIPFWGGERFEFFRPIFNIADSAITGGVLGILIFYRAELKTASKEKKGQDKLEDQSEGSPTEKSVPASFGEVG